MSDTGSELEEGVDFYRDGPFIVFTEHYLRARGYCCESGCRHCPWGYRNDVLSDRARDESEDE